MKVYGKICRIAFIYLPYKCESSESSFFLKVCEGPISVSLMHRRSYPLVLLRKAVMKICSKFTGEHPCRSVICEKVKSEITLRHECSPVNKQLY